MGRLEHAIVALRRRTPDERRSRAIAQLLESVVELVSSSVDAAVPARSERRPDRERGRRRTSGRATADRGGPRFPRFNAAIEAGAGAVEPLAVAGPASSPSSRPLSIRLQSPERRSPPPRRSAGRPALAMVLGLVLGVAITTTVGDRDGNTVPSGANASAGERAGPDLAAAPSTDASSMAADETENQPAAATVTARTAITGSTGMARVWLASTGDDSRPAASAQATLQLPAAAPWADPAGATTNVRPPPAIEWRDIAVPSMKGRAPAAIVPAAFTSAPARPAEGETLYQRAWALQRDGATEQAIALYREAAAVRPGHAATHYNWGYILQQKGDRAAAMDHYRQALALDPKHVYAHYNLAHLLEQEGDVAGAEALYRRAIALDPDHVHALYDLASMLARRDDVAGAIDLYRRVLALDPKHRWAAADLRALEARLDSG